MKKTAHKKRLIIVSNRLPISISRKGSISPAEAAEHVVKPSSGGLVTAMTPILKNRGGMWIGWPGTLETIDFDKLLAEGSKHFGYDLKPVSLTAEERDKFYYGFSNEVIWPLFHDLQTFCRFLPEYWETYKVVNRNFARTVVKQAQPDDYIWVHDYHLMNVALELRNMSVTSSLGFFLHTPFPPLDIFLKLPWRFSVLEALLNYDLIGFQTLRDRRNFVQCLRALMKDVEVVGKGQVIKTHLKGREIRIGVFPISIDFNEFAEMAASKPVSERAWFIHENLPKRQLILGVDRLDYTKGIPDKLEAFQKLLTLYPDLRQKLSLIQVVVPSREDIPKYFDLRTQIERMVSEINGRFACSGWLPVHYIFRNLEREELLAYYRTAEIALITPLKDRDESRLQRVLCLQR